MVAIFCILFVAILAGAGVWIYFSTVNLKQTKTIDGNRERVFNKSKLTQLIISISLAVIALLGIIVVPGSFHQIDAGEVAVVKVWGNAKEVRSAGIHFDFWISHKYEIYDCKVQQIEITTAAYSQDKQPMDIELYVQYQIQQNNAMLIAKNYGGLSMLEGRIKTVAIERTKAELSKYTATQLITERGEASQKVTDAVKNVIDDSYYSDVITVVLTDIDFSDAFEKSVEDTMIANQEKLKAEAENQKAIAKAEADLKIAEQEAKAKLVAAQGDANAQKAIADAEAYSTQIKIVELARVMGYSVTEEEIKGTQSVKNPEYVDEKTTPDVKEFIDKDVILGYKYTIDWTKDKDGNIVPDGRENILAYLQYLEYLAKWNGELPEVITGDSANILIPVSPSTQG